MIKVLEEQVNALVASIVEDAMADEYADAMHSFNDKVSPGMAKMIRTVFETGVQVGASRAFMCMVGGGK